MQFHIARACHAMIWFVIPLSTSPHRPPLSQLQLNYTSCGWFHLSRSRWFLSLAPPSFMYELKISTRQTERKKQPSWISFIFARQICFAQLRFRTDGRHTVNYCYTITLFNQPRRFEAKRVEQCRGKANIIKLSQGSSRPFSSWEKKKSKVSFSVHPNSTFAFSVMQTRKNYNGGKSSYSLCRWLSTTFPTIVFERSEEARFSQLYSVKICWQCISGVSERTGRKKALLYCSQSVIINLF